MLMEFTDVKNLIDKYVKNRAILEVESNEDTREVSFDKLNEIFNYGLDKTGYFNDFKEIFLNNAIIFMYSITSIDKTKTTKYIAYVEDNMPVSLVSYLEYENNNIIYAEQKYSTYMKNTKHIQTRMNIKSTVFNLTEILEANILDSSRGHYVRRNYELVSDKANILSLTVDKDKYFSSTVAFDERLELVLKDMGTISSKINDKITDCFSDENICVKEYSIKRKK